MLKEKKNKYKMKNIFHFYVRWVLTNSKNKNFNEMQSIGGTTITCWWRISSLGMYSKYLERKSCEEYHIIYDLCVSSFI